MLSQGQNPVQHDIILGQSGDRTLELQHTLSYVNNTGKVLNEMPLLDWANAYSDKESQLGLRFAEDFENRFYYASDAQRGRTVIQSIEKNGSPLEYYRREGSIDVLWIRFRESVNPGETITLGMQYSVVLPDYSFTRDGIKDDGEIRTSYWHLAPAEFQGDWQVYSHKDLPDYWPARAEYRIEMGEKLKGKTLFSSINDTSQDRMVFSPRRILPLHVFTSEETKSNFRVDNYEDSSTITDLKDSRLEEVDQVLAWANVMKYLHENLGEAPVSPIFISYEDLKENEVYGLNQLPSWIKAFPPSFQYELELLKPILDNYLTEALNDNPRTQPWIHNGMAIYLMMDYVDQRYPGLPIAGRISNFWGIRSFYAARLGFNDQYRFLYQHVARLNIDQALDTPVDKLTKINAQVANPYKAGVGLYYLDDYLGDRAVATALSNYFKNSKADKTSGDLLDYIAEETTKDVDWFRTDFVESGENIDWKLRNAEVQGDQIVLDIKNKTGVQLPIPVYVLGKKDSVLSKHYVDAVTGIEQRTIPLTEGARRVSINEESIAPEIIQRDNYQATGGFLRFNRPLQFRPFKDVEDPSRSQVFFMPVYKFNIYDGVSLGIKAYNKTILTKNFQYKLQPFYGLRSGNLIGNASLSYTWQFDPDENSKLFATRAGLSGSYFSFDEGLFYRDFTPFLTFAFRPQDLRSNARSTLNFRAILIDRDEDPSVEQDPNYTVFNAAYRHSDVNLLESFSYSVEQEVSKNFGKVYGSIKYRRLFRSNRQIEVRLFAGAFLYNDTADQGDFFSFALDRPTDYLFDLNYYGRSEDSGLFSQQLIISEGGFKSQLDTPFANQWITTANLSGSIWRYIHAYGDIGFVKNRDSSAQFVYDSGVRLNLVQDYFELYFPVYSNNGWEIAQDGYDQKIRFIVSLDIDTLTRLFTREWY